MAALFEVADDEFLRVRKESQELQKQAKETIEAFVVEPDSQELLDVFKFLAVAAKNFPSYDFVDFKADGFVQEIRTLDPNLKTKDFQEALKQQFDILSDYCRYQDETYFNKLDPYTIVRHALYLYDREKFRAILFERERKNFEKWLLDHLEAVVFRFLRNQDHKLHKNRKVATMAVFEEGWIADSLGMPEIRIRQGLEKLQDKGNVHEASTGRWALGTKRDFPK